MKKELMQKQHKSTKDKLTFIQNLLSGMIDISTYKTPQVYNVFVREEEERYEVRGLLSKKSEPVVFNQEQYDSWHGTLSEQDMVFIIRNQKGNEPLIEVAPNRIEPVPVVERLEERPKDVQTIAPKTEARKQPKKRLKNDPATIEAIQVRDEIFIMKSYGKLSEYGDTWKIQSRQNN
jgi:hypothetical protein